MTPDALLLLALKGIAVAALPLAYVRFSRDPAKFRKLAWVTAFLTLDLIMFGSFTRLTDSGLGCPDWPGCYGHSNPLSADEPIRAAQTALPSGPVTRTKAWIEMLHRYFAMGVGLLIVILAVMAWQRRRTSNRTAGLAVAALGWVVAQGAFGAWTVTMKLQPVIVTIHLLGGIGLLALLTWLALRESEVAPVPAPPSLALLARVAFVVLIAQIALGGWVSANYAVMACPDFPLCQGQWAPPMDFIHGFTLWRPLGMTGAGDAIPFQALVAIHWAHRMFAAIAAGLLIALVWRSWSIAPLATPARALAAALGLQLLTGMSNVVLQWPLALAVLHTGGAAVLAALLVAFNVRLAVARQDRPVAVRLGR